MEITELRSHPTHIHREHSIIAVIHPVRILRLRVLGLSILGRILL